MLVFSTQLCELLLFSPSLWFKSTLSPLPCVNKVYLYTRIQCVRGGGGMGFWVKTDKHLPQSTFTGQSMSLIFLRVYLKDFVVPVGPTKNVQKVIQDHTAHLGPENVKDV
jgi:hypothetical protein